MEKTGNAETKANIQLPFHIRKIDSRCPKGHYLLTKKDKKDTYQELCNEASKDKNKAKSQTSSFTHQPQAQAHKKDKRSCWRGHLVTGVNTTKVVKKDKDKVRKNLSHIKYYTCNQKSYYANKCPKKTKN